MKKFMKGLLALAGALSFLAVGCSGGTTYVGTSSSASGDKSTTVTASKLGFSALTAESADTSVATAEVVSGDVKITGVKAGETTVTVTGTKTSADIAGVSLDTTTVTKKIKVVVASTLAVTATPEDDTSGNEGSDDSKKEKETATTKATAKTYSFAGGTNGIALADVSGWDMATKDVISSPVAASLTEKILSNGATLHWKGSAVGTLRFRSKHDADATLSETIVSAATAINYNGGYGSSLSSGVTLSAVDRYVSFPVDGAGTVSAEVTFKGKDDETATGTLQVAFVDADGKLLGDVVEDGIKDSSTKTVTATTTGATTVSLVFSRNGATYMKKGSATGTGGMDVTKIEVKPAE